MSNVIQTEFTTLDVMLRRVREANPSEVVIVYPIDQEDDDLTRVSWVGLQRTKLVGMLTGAAMDVWNTPDKVERTIGPGESA